MGKLLVESDLNVLRLDSYLKGYWISPVEMRETIRDVGEVAYCLYTYYRTFPFNESSELSDSDVGNNIGWPSKKVQKYRLMLENQGLFLLVRYGSKTDGITKMFVGKDVVALHNAGLPSNILEGRAFQKLKKKFNIKSSSELVNKINLLVQEYENNPNEY